MNATANGLRAVAQDITTRCKAGEFGRTNSLLRARMDAHAVRLWMAATAIDEQVDRAISRREIEGVSPCHRAMLWLRALLGLRRGVEKMLAMPPAGLPFDARAATQAHAAARATFIARAKDDARKLPATRRESV